MGANVFPQLEAVTVTSPLSVGLKAPSMCNVASIVHSLAVTAQMVSPAVFCAKTLIETSTWPLGVPLAALPLPIPPAAMLAPVLTTDVAMTLHGLMPYQLSL